MTVRLGSLALADAFNPSDRAVGLAAPKTPSGSRSCRWGSFSALRAQGRALD